MKFLLQKAVERLHLESFESEKVRRYTEQSGVIKSSDFELLASDVKTIGNQPELEIPVEGQPSKSDATNARRLFEWLRPGTWRQANDPRLWTYLTHEVFADYCRRRWPFGSEDPGNLIRSRWILRGESRGAVSRHALARLWWAAEATWRPSRYVPETKESEESEGEWFFTNLLLRNQDAFQALRERKFGSNPHVLLAALQALKDEESVGPAARHLALQLNLIGTFQVLDMLPWPALVVRCSEILRQWRASRSGTHRGVPGG